ncbi:MAG: efflux transporter outer membrane subunit [Legionella sp.]|uniref:efflux transporter outer membrane subunit n=1 Tax=Legionella sp. TaxID=459 RepID=UPI0039E66594
MRVLLITSLVCVTALTNCHFYSVVHSEVPEIGSAELTVKHVYKKPKSTKTKSHLTRFNDPQLRRLVAIALHDAPDIGSAKARVMQAREIAKGTYSTLWPSATLSGYVNKQWFSLKGTVPSTLDIPVTEARIANLALNFNYELDLWGKNRNNFASKLSEAFAAEMDLAQTRLIISSTVASVYFDLQNDIIQQQLAKENVHILQEEADIVLGRAKQGIESDIPLKTAISNTQSARLAIQDYQRMELQSRHQLAVLMGKNPFNTQIEVQKFSYDPKQLALPEVISTNVLARRPDIASTRALTEAAAHQINVARAAFFPDINLTSILSLQSFYFANFFNFSVKDAGIKPAFTLPIFDAGQRRANLGARQAAFELTVNQYNQTILNALQEVTDQMAALHTLKKQIADQKKALNTTEGNYKLFRSRYTQGIIDYLQLLEIKQLLVQQRATLYSLQTHQKQAMVALLAALGGEVIL